MSYSAAMYGVSRYGEQVEKDQGDSNSYIPDLLRYLPTYYHREGTMKTLQQTVALELGEWLYECDVLLNQFFIDSATWGLDLWEAEFGLSTDRTKSFAQRRELVKAKMRGVGTTTKEMIRDTAASFSGGHVEITEYSREARFEIQYVGIKGIPSNMAGFIHILEEIKPAHLAHSFKYSYTEWTELRKASWLEMKQETWDSLKVFDGLNLDADG